MPRLNPYPYLHYARIALPQAMGEGCHNCDHCPGPWEPCSQKRLVIEDDGEVLFIYCRAWTRRGEGRE